MPPGFLHFRMFTNVINNGVLTIVYNYKCKDCNL